jgi:hypothetical protein
MICEYNTNKVIKSQGFDMQLQQFDCNHKYMEIYSTTLHFQMFTFLCGSKKFLQAHKEVFISNNCKVASLCNFLFFEKCFEYKLLLRDEYQNCVELIHW